MAIKITRSASYGVCTSCKVQIPEEVPDCPICGRSLKTENISYDERIWETPVEKMRKLNLPKNEGLLMEILVELGINRRKFLGMLETIPRKVLREKLGSESWSVLWKNFASFLGENEEQAREIIQRAMSNSKTIAVDVVMFRRILRYECGTFFTTSENERFKVSDLEKVLSVEENLNSQLTANRIDDRLLEMALLYESDYKKFVGLIKQASGLVKPANEYPVGYDASMEIGYWSNYNKFGS